VNSVVAPELTHGALNSPIHQPTKSPMDDDESKVLVSVIQRATVFDTLRRQVTSPERKADRDVVQKQAEIN
jgi:hypothetical protein